MVILVMVKLLKVTPVMRMMNEEYHTASPAEMCLKVGKENIKVTVTHCMNNEKRVKQSRSLVVRLYWHGGGGQ